MVMLVVAFMLFKTGNGEKKHQFLEKVSLVDSIYSGLLTINSITM